MTRNRGRDNHRDKVRLIPGHCDPTVNLCDWYVYIAATESSSSGPDFSEKTYAIPALCGDRMPVRCRGER